MRKTQARRIDHVNLLKFITVNPTTNSIVIKYDQLCQYLFKNEGRNFFPSEFEKTFIQETKKLEKFVIDQVALTKICDYIDDLSAYLTIEKRRTAVGDIGLQMQRFQKSRPEEYQKVREKYLQDMEIAKARNPKVYEKMLSKYRRRFGDDIK